MPKYGIWHTHSDICCCWCRALGGSVYIFANCVNILTYVKNPKIPYWEGVVLATRLYDWGRNGMGAICLVLLHAGTEREEKGQAPGPGPISVTHSRRLDRLGRSKSDSNLLSNRARFSSRSRSCLGLFGPAGTKYSGKHWLKGRRASVPND
jgi:hypothetical protein